LVGKERPMAVQVAQQSTHGGYGSHIFDLIHQQKDGLAAMMYQR